MSCCLDPEGEALHGCSSLSPKHGCKAMDGAKAHMARCFSAQCFTKTNTTVSSNGVGQQAAGSRDGRPFWTKKLLNRGRHRMVPNHGTRGAQEKRATQLSPPRSACHGPGMAMQCTPAQTLPGRERVPRMLLLAPPCPGCFEDCLALLAWGLTHRDARRLIGV